jgi:hypothetical protein
MQAKRYNPKQIRVSKGCYKAGAITPQSLGLKYYATLAESECRCAYLPTDHLVLDPTHLGATRSALGLGHHNHEPSRDLAVGSRSAGPRPTQSRFDPRCY